MHRKLVFMFVAITFVFSLASFGFSETNGNSRKGKHLFRNSCRECHQEDATAKPLSPDSKTQAQWERVFKPDNYNKLDCKDEWAKHSEQDLADIFTYLHKHAFDSPSPAKCK